MTCHRMVLNRSMPGPLKMGCFRLKNLRNGKETERIEPKNKNRPYTECDHHQISRSRARGLKPLSLPSSAAHCATLCKRWQLFSFRNEPRKTRPSMLRSSTRTTSSGGKWSCPSSCSPRGSWSATSLSRGEINPLFWNTEFQS